LKWLIEIFIQIAPRKEKDEPVVVAKYTKLKEGMTTIYSDTSSYIGLPHALEYGDLFQKYKDETIRLAFAKPTNQDLQDAITNHNVQRS
jgi:hypothetical protein